MSLPTNQPSMVPTIWKYCRACGQLLSSKIVVSAIALAVFALVGGDAIKDWVIGRKTMTQAQQEILINLAGFIDNPVVRLAFGLLALFFIVQGTHRIVLAEERAAAIMAQNNSMLLANQRALIAVPMMLAANLSKARQLRQFSTDLDFKKAQIEAHAAQLAFYDSAQKYVDILPISPSFQGLLGIPMDYPLLEISVISPAMDQREPRTVQSPQGHLGRKLHEYNPSDNPEFVSAIKRNIGAARGWIRDLERARDSVILRSILPSAS